MKILVNDFNLCVTLDSGQVFGFTKDQSNRRYQGQIGGATSQVWQNGKYLFVESGDLGLTKEQVTAYFDLSRDLSPIYKILNDEKILKPAYTHCKGLRLIQQDSWEALACFILSSNNNIKRIQMIWRNIQAHFSKDGPYASFPKPNQIAQSHERILRTLGLGYRAPFLLGTARFISKNPEYLEYIRQEPYRQAVARVTALPGIGPKVADCVLLYGFQKYEAFPVDVWILRVMRKLYFNNRNISEAKVHEFATKRWGVHAGYIQQYIFHSAKEGVI